MMRLGIVTDDLTSATDGTAAFAQAGWPVRIVRGAAGISAGGTQHSPVTSIDAASRTTSVVEAIRRVRAATLLVRSAPLIVKQFDSTLRGHVAEEVSAMLHVSNRDRVVVAAAFPSAGRTTLAGRQLVHGQPLEKTTYSRDPLSPAATSDLCALFRDQGLSTSQDPGASANVLVLDASTEGDMDAIAEKFAASTDVLLAGSTGLLRALARNLPPPVAMSHQYRLRGERTLVVVGSINPTSREQLDALRLGAVPTFEIEASTPAAATADSIRLSFEAGVPAVALTTPLASRPPREMSRAIAVLAANLVRQQVVDSLIVTGGDTLAAILDQLKADTLVVRGELEPGIALCQLAQPRSLPIVSKAGGFGGAEFFVDILRALRQSSEGITA